jgi:uncharacterized protein YceK
MRRVALLLALVTLAGCGGAASRTASSESGLVVLRAAMRPGTIDLFVHNGTARPATLAQVSIDSGFVGFGGPPRTVAAHADAILALPYPWVQGEGYTVKLLTGDGQTVGYRIAPPPN